MLGLHAAVQQRQHLPGLVQLPKLVWKSGCSRFRRILANRTCPPQARRSFSAGCAASSDLNLDQFVQHFKQASPYIVGHRDKTFVVIIPGQVVARDDLLAGILEDLALLHGMGVGLVVVVGCSCAIDSSLQKLGKQPTYVDGYRVTDDDALCAAVNAAGHARSKIEGFFSKSPPVPLVRRHEKGSHQLRNGSGMGVISGNYVVAKRRGIVGGVDFLHTGEVRAVLDRDIAQQLELGNLVLLTNLGYTAGGNILNCNVNDVGLHTAVQVKADKLCCLHLEEVTSLALPRWLALGDALSLIQEMPSSKSAQTSNNGKPDGLNPISSTESQLPRSVKISVAACEKGVKRSHLVNAEINGGLLLELYTRDGIGTMISTDFYQGIRPAIQSDVSGIKELLDPLSEQGITIQRDLEDLAAEVSNFRVFEQEGKVLGCALIKDVGLDTHGDAIMEVAAFCMHPSIQGKGKGDSMLEYIEQEAMSRGVGCLTILTTRTADWFVQRGFRFDGPAASSSILPDSRKSTINAERNSELYVKRFWNRE